VGVPLPFQEMRFRWLSSSPHSRLAHGIGERKASTRSHEAADVAHEPRPASQAKGCRVSSFGYRLPSRFVGILRVAASTDPLNLAETPPAPYIPS